MFLFEIYLLEIEVNKIETTTIEIDEDALGDEVYYNHPKFGRKLVDETDLDEERIQAPQENISHRMRILENQIQVLTNQQSHLIEYLYRVMDRTGVSDERRCDSEDPLNTEGYIRFCCFKFSYNKINLLY